MYTVLIVEDELLVSAGLKSMVHWADMDMAVIGEARNGKQGLEKYRQLKPDMILTDIKMPVMDGLEMITQIRKEDTETRIIVLTCYEEFDLVRQAFKLGISDYILKLKMLPEEIEQVISKVYEEMIQSQTRRKTEDNRTNQPERMNHIRNQCRDYILHASCAVPGFGKIWGKLGMEEREMAVCMLEVFPYQQKHQSKEGKQEEKTEAVILDLLQELVSKDNGGQVWQEREKRYLIVLGIPDRNDQQKREAFFRDLTFRMRILIRSRLNRNTVFGFSSFTDFPEELQRLYREAAKALEMAVFLGEDFLIYGAVENQQKYEKKTGDFWEQMEKLEIVTESYQQNVMKEISFMRNGGLSESADVKEILIRWIHWVSFDRGIQKKEVLKFALETVEQIRCSATLQEMYKIMDAYSRAMKQGAKDTSMVSREVAETISYIKQHYCESDLSLSTAARKAAMHKDYLSKLFKQETGSGFSEYVNIQRIKKAQELLITTHMKSYEIAQEVGFQDESYFSRVFKKFVGIRPNEYKRREMT